MQQAPLIEPVRQAHSGPLPGRWPANGGAFTPAPTLPLTFGLRVVVIVFGLLTVSKHRF